MTYISPIIKAVTGNITTNAPKVVASTTPTTPTTTTRTTSGVRRTTTPTIEQVQASLNQEPIYNIVINEKENDTIEPTVIKTSTGGFVPLPVKETINPTPTPTIEERAKELATLPVVKLVITSDASLTTKPIIEETKPIITSIPETPTIEERANIFIKSISPLEKQIILPKEPIATNTPTTETKNYTDNLDNLTPAEIGQIIKNPLYSPEKKQDLIGTSILNYKTQQILSDIQKPYVPSTGYNEYGYYPPGEPYTNLNTNIKSNLDIINANINYSLQAKKNLQLYENYIYDIKTKITELEGLPEEYNTNPDYKIIITIDGKQKEYTKSEAISFFKTNLTSTISDYNTNKKLSTKYFSFVRQKRDLLSSQNTLTAFQEAGWKLETTDKGLTFVTPKASEVVESIYGDRKDLYVAQSLRAMGVGTLGSLIQYDITLVTSGYEEAQKVWNEEIERTAEGILGSTPKRGEVLMVGKNTGGLLISNPLITSFVSQVSGEKQSFTGRLWTSPEVIKDIYLPVISVGIGSGLGVITKTIGGTTIGTKIVSFVSQSDKAKTILGLLGSNIGQTALIGGTYIAFEGQNIIETAINKPTRLGSTIGGSAYNYGLNITGLYYGTQLGMESNVSERLLGGWNKTKDILQQQFPGITTRSENVLSSIGSFTQQNLDVRMAKQIMGNMFRQNLLLYDDLSFSQNIALRTQQFKNWFNIPMADKGEYMFSSNLKTDTQFLSGVEERPPYGTTTIRDITRWKEMANYIPSEYESYWLGKIPTFDTDLMLRSVGISELNKYTFISNEGIITRGRTLFISSDRPGILSPEIDENMIGSQLNMDLEGDIKVFRPTAKDYTGYITSNETREAGKEILTPYLDKEARDFIRQSKLFEYEKLGTEELPILPSETGEIIDVGKPIGYRYVKGYKEPFEDYTIASGKGESITLVKAGDLNYTLEQKLSYKYIPNEWLGVYDIPISNKEAVMSLSLTKLTNKKAIWTFTGMGIDLISNKESTGTTYIKKIQKITGFSIKSLENITPIKKYVKETITEKLFTPPEWLGVYDIPISNKEAVMWTPTKRKGRKASMWDYEGIAIDNITVMEPRYIKNVYEKTETAFDRIYGNLSKRFYTPISGYDLTKGEKYDTKTGLSFDTQNILGEESKTDLTNETLTGTINKSSLGLISFSLTGTKLALKLETRLETKLETITETTTETINLIDNTPEIDIFEPTEPYPPKPIPITIIPFFKTQKETETFSKKKTQKQKESAYDVYVKERSMYHRQVRKPTHFIKMNKQPLTESEALALGGNITDRSSAISFKIKTSKGKPSKLKELVKPWENIQHKFTKRGNVYIEKTPYRIDSEGEIKGISALGWNSNKIKKIKNDLFGNKGKGKNVRFI